MSLLAVNCPEISRMPQLANTTCRCLRTGTSVALKSLYLLSLIPYCIHMFSRAVMIFYGALPFSDGALSVQSCSQKGSARSVVYQLRALIHSYLTDSSTSYSLSNPSTNVRIVLIRSRWTSTCRNATAWAISGIVTVNSDSKNCCSSSTALGSMSGSPSWLRASSLQAATNCRQTKACSSFDGQLRGRSTSARLKEGIAPWTIGQLDGRLLLA